MAVEAFYRICDCPEWVEVEGCHVHRNAPTKIHLLSIGFTEERAPFEERFCFTLSHEYLHILLDALEGTDTSDMLDMLRWETDRINGTWDPSGLPSPNE